MVIALLLNVEYCLYMYCKNICACDSVILNPNFSTENATNMDCLLNESHPFGNQRHPCHTNPWVPLAVVHLQLFEAGSHGMIQEILELP